MKTFFLIFFLLYAGLTAQRLEKSIVYISDFVASEKFSEIRENYGDLAAIDSVYSKTLCFYKGDVSETLLALTFALLADDKLPLKIPLIEVNFDIPLPSAEDSLFRAKVKNLPGNMFFDSNDKDKDKLAHFFGSAFLAYNFGCLKAPEYIGIFVEYFEAAFKVHGALDRKDIIINYLGGHFGRSLKDNNGLFPSTLFNLYALLFLIL